MNHQTRHGSRRCKPPGSVRHSLSHQLRGTATPVASPSLRNTALPQSTRSRSVLTMVAGSATLAGPLCWGLTRSVAISLGVVLNIAVTAATATWLLAREETQQVRARERGATEREQIRHHGETLLAEAQHLLLKATTCGPSSTPVDAQVLRADAREALQLIQPTSVSDAMRITNSRGF